MNRSIISKKIWISILIFLLVWSGPLSIAANSNSFTDFDTESEENINVDELHEDFTSDNQQTESFQEEITSPEQTTEEMVNEHNTYTNMDGEENHEEKNEENNEGNEQSVIYSAESFEIFVKQQSGDTFSLYVHPDETVAQLKQKIFTASSLPIEKQLLMYDNLVLEDHSELQDYDIHAGATIIIYLKMEETDFEWTKNDDGTATITKYVGSKVNIIIPEKLDGLTVTKISNTSFQSKNIETVVFPDSIQEIGNYSFRNNKITAIHFGSGITKIGHGAFYNNKLTEIKLPDTIEFIGQYAFENNKLKKVDIPENLTGIEYGAFMNNEITEINFNGNKLRYIFALAFQNNLLTEIIFPANVTNIRDQSFVNNPLDAVAFYSKEVSFIGNPFENNSNLTIYGYVDSTVEQFALQQGYKFNDINGLYYDWVENEDETITITGYKGTSEDITIPETINRLTVTSIGADAFSNKQIKSVTIPNTVTSIGERAFQNNQLETIEIPNQVTNIDSYAFANNNLTSITLPENITTISNSAFENNDITNLSIPNNVKSIAMNAFKNNNILSLIIPKNIQTLGEGAFAENSLLNVVFLNENTMIAQTTFNNNPELIVIGHDPSTAKNFASTNNLEFKDIETIPEYIFEWEQISSSTVKITNYMGKVKDVIIPETLDGFQVTKIDDAAFENKGITSVSIPESIIDIGKLAFSKNNLTNIEIPSSVYSLGDRAFSENQLSQVKIYNKDMIIGDEAFESTNYNSALTIWGYTLSNAEAYAEAYEHHFIPLDSKPNVSIEFIGEVVNNELSVKLLSTGELTANYSHDFAEIIDVFWVIDEQEVIQGKSLNLETVTESLGKKKITLVVLTEFFAYNIKEIMLDVYLPIPDKPKLLNDSVTETTVKLSWSKSLYTENYILLRNGKIVYMGNDLTFEDLGLHPGEKYRYELIARNESGDSDADIIEIETEKSANNRLSDLTVSAGKISPKFNAETENYTVHVPEGIEHIYVEANLEDETASLQVNGRNVENGKASELIQLTPGNITEVEVQVTAQNGAIKTYQLEIISLMSEIDAGLDLDGDTAKVSDERIDRMDYKGVIIIRLTNELNDINRIFVNQEQVELLRSKQATIRVEKDGVTLTIPFTVLPDNKSITIHVEQLTKDIQLPSVEDAMSAIYNFVIEIDNEIVRQFNGEIELIFPVTGFANSNPENLKVYYWNEDDEKWELVGGEYKEGFIHVRVDHFTIFTVFDINSFAEAPDQETDTGGSEKDTNTNEREQATEDEKNVENSKKGEIESRLTDSNSSSKLDGQHDKKLPQTATNTLLWIIFGFIIMITGIVIFSFNRMRRLKNE